MKDTEEKCMDCKTPVSELSEPPWGRYINGAFLSQCKPCKDKEIEAKIKEFQELETETEYEGEVICPYCGHMHERDFETSEMFTDGEHDFTCYYCRNDFELETSVSYTYSTYKKDIDLLTPKQ